MNSQLASALIQLKVLFSDVICHFCSFFPVGLIIKSTGLVWLVENAVELWHVILAVIVGPPC